MSKHKRDSTSLFEVEYEEIYIDIDDAKSKGKKRAIADERTEIDVDGITTASQKNKRCSDVTSDDDIVDKIRLADDTLKKNNIYKCCYLSQAHSLGAARCTDGMSSQGTTKAINKYDILIEKIKRLMNMVAEMAEEIKENKQNRKVVSEKNDEIMQSK